MQTWELLAHGVVQGVGLTLLLVPILAGVGVGLYPSVREACDQMIHVSAQQEPNPQSVAQYQKNYAFYHSLYPCMQDAFKRLAK